MGREHDRIRAQLGPFAIVPVWVLDRCTDSRAIHLYALLGKYANREHRAWPKIESLAAGMKTSKRSVSIAIALLRQVGALQTARRRRADGSVMGLDFLLVQVPPDDTSNLQPGADTTCSPLPVGDTFNLQPGADTTCSPLPVGDTSNTQPAAETTCSPLPVSKDELDPLNQIQERTSTGAPRRHTPRPVKISNPSSQATPGTFGLYCIIAREARQQSNEVDRSDQIGNIAEWFKTLCAQRSIQYDGEIVTQAIEAVMKGDEQKLAVGGRR